MIASTDPADDGMSSHARTTSRWGESLGQRVYVGMLMLAGLVMAGTIAVLASRVISPVNAGRR
jgi:hypothetical protein